MTKMYSRALATSLAILLLVLAPACRSSRKKVDQPPQSETTMTVPDVPPPPTETVASVEPPRDFVNETPDPVEQPIPSDIEELNRWAQQRGHIRDAFFTYDEAGLDGDAQTALSASANWLKSAEGASYGLLIEGHCDERGTEQYNLALGDRRANAAKDYLVTLGVDAGRIRTVSYGEERPFEQGGNESAFAQNRRAHLVLVR